MSGQGREPRQAMFEFLKLEMLSGDIYKQVTAAAVFLGVASWCSMRIVPLLAHSPRLRGGGWRRATTARRVRLRSPAHHRAGVGRACALVHRHSCECPGENAHRDEEYGEWCGWQDSPTLIGQCVRDLPRTCRLRAACPESPFSVPVLRACLPAHTVARVFSCGFVCAWRTECAGLLLPRCAAGIGGANV